MRVAAVVHPLTLPEPTELRRLLDQRCAQLGHEVVSWQETTVEDVGTGQASQAVAVGAQLVVVAGGDGTVRAAVDALAHTRAALGIVPTGTGNLLARNLGLPLDIPAALEVALTGRHRRLDVGCVRVGADPATPVSRFVVMAGLGFDAAMMADASASLKARVGWPAYLLSAVRHVRDEAVRCTLTLDDHPPRRLQVRTVLIGNVGQLQAGLQLLPDASPDDGVLDVAVIAPRGVVDWLRVVGRVVAAGSASDRRLERATARQVQLRTRTPQRYELDGDPLGRTTSLVVTVEPGALTVVVPP